jgi:putative hemolysin
VEVLLDSTIMSFLSSTGPIGLVLLLLICSALISGSEVALFSLTPAQKATLHQSEDSISRTIVGLLEEPDRETAPKRLLATILLANNAVNIAIVLITEGLMPTSLEPGWFEFLINVIVITFIIVLFGEVIPKVYATTHNMAVARFMATPLLVIQKTFSPITWFLIRTSGALETRWKEATAGNISVDELGHALELTQDDSRTREEHMILEGIVTFGAKDVQQIMTPRTDIVPVWWSDSFEEVLHTITEAGYSRYPVYKDSPDKIEGFLFVKDIIPHIDQVQCDWQTLVRPPFFVPENKKIDDLLQSFQKEKVHLAIVVDEYGGTSGLVTMEDILEEIVGEISDEFDEEELQYSKLDAFNYVFEAKTPLVDIYRILELDESAFEAARGDSSTLGGFVTEQSGRIPEKGDLISFESYQFRIEAADKRKIKRIKITLPSSENTTRS